jgi:phenylalanyl-tRNA synthetase beta chain
MNVSRKWLQKYFDAALPDGQSLADAFTFHSFEVEEQAGDLLDLKVLPDRAGYALSHRGVARELAAALDTPLSSDPLRTPLPAFPKTNELTVAVENPEQCPRYLGALVRGVTVGPSPDWLREALLSVGQRSINNVVDATNYVMLDLGQPLHAFDAKKLARKNGAYAIAVRSAHAGENITTLSGDEYALPEGAQVIADANADTAIGIAGIKGGKAAEVDRETTDLVIESANFDGTAVRRAAQKLKLTTDASLRFQNRPSPELAAYGMRDVLSLITEIAGGEVVGVVDEYPAPKAPAPIVSSLARVNGLLGGNFSQSEVESVSRRLDLPYSCEGQTFTVIPRFERTDLVIPEDLAEEVGRILGYDRLPATELPATSREVDQARWKGQERMKDELVEQGFTEVSTQSFAKKGDFLLANPLDKKMPALRTSLEQNLSEALVKAKQYAPLVLPPGEKAKLFEVGTVFPKEGEHIELRMTEAAWDGVPTVDNLSVAKLEDYGKDYEAKRYGLGAFKPFSQYPFVTRDVAAWVPEGVSEESFAALVRMHAGELLVRLDALDRFQKDGKTSLAFRLVFQSFERTLTDEEVNAVMEKVYAALRAAGYDIR